MIPSHHAAVIRRPMPPAAGCPNVDAARHQVHIVIRVDELSHPVPSWVNQNGRGHDWRGHDGRGHDRKGPPALGESQAGVHRGLWVNRDSASRWQLVVPQSVQPFVHVVQILHRHSALGDGWWSGSRVHGERGHEMPFVFVRLGSVSLSTTCWRSRGKSVNVRSNRQAPRNSRLAGYRFGRFQLCGGGAGSQAGPVALVEGGLKHAATGGLGRGAPVPRLDAPHLFKQLLEPPLSLSAHVVSLREQSQRSLRRLLGNGLRHRVSLTTGVLQVLDVAIQRLELFLLNGRIGRNGHIVTEAAVGRKHSLLPLNVLHLREDAAQEIALRLAPFLGLCADGVERRCRGLNRRVVRREFCLGFDRPREHGVVSLSPRVQRSLRRSVSQIFGIHRRKDAGHETGYRLGVRVEHGRRVESRLGSQPVERLLEVRVEARRVHRVTARVAVPWLLAVRLTSCRSGCSFLQLLDSTVIQRTIQRSRGHGSRQVSAPRSFHGRGAWMLTFALWWPAWRFPSEGVIRAVVGWVYVLAGGVGCLCGATGPSGLYKVMEEYKLL